MQASSDPSDVVRQATRAGILLIVLLLVGSIIASIVYRLIARRWLDEQPKKSAATARDKTPDGEHEKGRDPDHPTLKPRL